MKYLSLKWQQVFCFNVSLVINLKLTFLNGTYLSDLIRSLCNSLCGNCILQSLFWPFCLAFVGLLDSKPLSTFLYVQLSREW